MSPPDLSQKRRAIKAAQRQLGMEQDDYQALLRRVTGKGSSTQLSLRECRQVLDALRDLGWQPVRKNARQIARIQYLWMRLGEANKLTDPSKAAMQQFCSKYIGKVPLHRANPMALHKVIDCLQGWCKRENVPYQHQEASHAAN